MTGLIMIACFLAFPVGVLIGYRAGYRTAEHLFSLMRARELELMRSNVQSAYLRGRTAANPHTATKKD